MMLSQFEDIEGKKILEFSPESVSGRELIFTSSMSDSLAQEKLIRKTGFSGEIVVLPDLKHLSATLMLDVSSDEEVMLKLKDKHKNQPAFVIGNGASLLETDPRNLPDSVVTFAGNGIVRLEGFVPDYFFSLDYSALVHWSEEIFALESTRFFPANLYEQIYESGDVVRDAKNVFYHICYERNHDLNIDDWYEHGFETGHTIICPMLQMAAWMGCGPIYLIGVDLSHDKKGNYFSDSYHQSSFSGYKSTQLQAFKHKLPRGILRSIEACKRNGVDVFNLSLFKSLPGVVNICFKDVVENL
jgi:hypothetical protein